MGLSELCIRRPVLTTLVTTTFIVFGIFAYRLLPVAALPAVDFPTISVTATLPGASGVTSSRATRRQSPSRAASMLAATPLYSGASTVSLRLATGAYRFVKVNR